MDRTLRPRMRAGLSPLRSVGLATSAALVATAMLAPSGALVLAATPAYVQPTPVAGGGIVVDGSRGDWAGTAPFAPMYRAAKATKQLESRLYLRYDCAAGRLYAMVETSPGVTLQPGGDQFVKIDGRKVAGSPAVGDFALSPDALGWEASAALAAGTYDLDVHAAVLDGGPQTSAVVDRSIALVVACSTAPGADPSVDPSTAPGAAASADPSTAPGAAASADPSTAPSADPSVDPSAAPSADPSADPSTAPGAVVAAPSASPSTEPDFGGDPDPHDQQHGPTGICGCAEPASAVGSIDTASSADPSSDPYQGAVLGRVTDPTATLPATDTAPLTPIPADDMSLRVVLVLLAVSLAALVLAPRRPARPTEERPKA